MTMMTGQAIEIAPCSTSEREAALGVLYRRTPWSMRPGMVAEVLRQAESGALDLSGLWVARRRGRIVAAMLTQALAGRAAAIWPPEVGASWNKADLAVSMVQSALAFYRDRSFLLAQSLVDSTSPRRATEDLTRGGLPYVTDLIYMTRSTLTPLPISPQIPRFRWEPFQKGREEEFGAVLRQTYVGSLDMPELEGIRSLDDVMASHQVDDRFDPTYWQLGRLPGEPEAAAILLLSRGLDRGTWEVSYLGLTPVARGRGLGLSALRHALDRARPHAQRLELAVDLRNHPADRLYQRAGFRSFDRRGVHVVSLSARSSDAPAERDLAEHRARNDTAN